MDDHIKDIHAQNKKSWDAVHDAHNSHKPNQKAFLEQEGSTLFDQELTLLGDVSSKRILHVLCNCGQDTISLSQRNPEFILGVDISQEAIATAQHLSKNINKPVEFECANIYDWLKTPTHTDFDIAFLSYGVLYWLYDLNVLFEGLRQVLRPEGKVVLIDFHPAAHLFKEHSEDFVLRFPWSSHGRAMKKKGVCDYVARSRGALTPSGWNEGIQNFTNPHESYEFFWGLGDILSSLLACGYRISAFEEYNYSNGCKLFKSMQPHPHLKKRFVFPETIPSIPSMFSLVANT